MGNGHANYKVDKNGKIAVKSKPIIIIIANDTEATRKSVLRFIFQKRNFIDLVFIDSKADKTNKKTS